MKKYIEFILEHKFWGKNIKEFLNWINSKSEKNWVILDTETTGLPHDPYEIQLTQVSCLIIKYNFSLNTFEEVGSFNKKIKLTSNTLEIMKNPKSRIDWVLNFNHYKKEDAIHDEKETLKDLFEFIKKYNNPILVIQNADFDMRYLNTRNSIVKFDNEVIDTKQIIQLFYLPTLQKLSETEEWAKQMVNKIGTSDRDNGLISSSMGKVAPALGIDMNGYHDAITDCRITVQMFQKMIEFLKSHENIDIKKYQAERIKTKR